MMIHLEGGRHYFEIEHHHDYHKNAPFRDECHFFLVIQVHLDFIVATEPVHEVVDLVSRYYIQYVVGEG